MKNTLKKIKVPTFELIQINHRTKLEGKKTLATHAFTIEVLVENKKEMIQSISEFFRETPTAFAAYRLRHESPESFYNAVRKQNHYLTNQHIVIIKNVSKAMMFYIEPHLRMLSDVHDVVIDRNHAQNGRWNVLVDKEGFQDVRDTIHERFESWIKNHVQPDGQAKEGQSQGCPMVQYPETGDVFSDASYFTDKAKSFLSMDGLSLD